MDEQSQKVLAEILAKGPGALTDSETEFLRARRSYLNEEQRTVFAEVLGDKPEASEDKPSKKGKKDE